MSQIRDLVDGKVVEELQRAVSEPSPISIDLPDGYMDTMAVAQQLGLEKQSEISRYQDDIQNIVNWAKLEGYENSTELKWMIRALQYRLGTPPLGEKWVARVSRYAFLKLQENKIQEEANGLMK